MPDAARNGLDERPQHLQALEAANRTRLARAGLKRRIRSGAVPVADVLADPPECVQTMTIGQLLGAQLRWGPARARKLLADVLIGEGRRIGSLSPRQRRIIAEGLVAPSRWERRLLR